MVDETAGRFDGMLYLHGGKVPQHFATRLGKWATQPQAYWIMIASLSDFSITSPDLQMTMEFNLGLPFFLGQCRHCYGGSCQVRYLLFHQLWLNTEHRISINVPPHREACFCFDLGAHAHNRSPPCPVFGLERTKRSTAELSPLSPLSLLSLLMNRVIGVGK